MAEVVVRFDREPTPCRVQETPWFEESFATDALMFTLCPCCNVGLVVGLVMVTPIEVVAAVLARLQPASPRKAAVHRIRIRHEELAGRTRRNV